MSVVAGTVCLLAAAGLALFAPGEGAAPFLFSDVERGKKVPRLTKLEREEKLYERGVAEEYLEKADRGMDLREVGWITEDFMALGLDREYPEDLNVEGYLDLRQKREKWYLDTLVLALRLNEEQERQAEETLAGLRERDLDEFRVYLEGVKSFEHEGRKMKLIDGRKARKFTDAGLWLGFGNLPSVLCELSEEQKFLTMDESLEHDPFQGAFPGFYSPDHSSFGLSLFWFTSEQEKKFHDAGTERKGLLWEVMCLHPAQLRGFLLTDPDLCERLRKEIEAAGR